MRASLEGWDYPPGKRSPERSLEFGQACTEVDVKDLPIQGKRGNRLDAEIIRLGEAPFLGAEVHNLDVEPALVRRTC